MNVHLVRRISDLYYLSPTVAPILATCRAYF